MSNLILDSLEIRNFRGFRELRVEHLGRVSLIVGKNNVGKTSILEALRLYTQPGAPEVLLELLEARDEIELRTSRRINAREARSVVVEGLFYGRRAIPGETPSIYIGSLKSNNRTLSIILESLKRSSNSETLQQTLLPPLDRGEESSIGQRLRLTPLSRIERVLSLN